MSTNYRELLEKILTEGYERWTWDDARFMNIALNDGTVFKYVDGISGDDLRWSRIVTIITGTPDGKFYAWDYEEGLTEMQEDMGPNEIGLELREVQKIEKTITVTEWEECK